MIIRVDTTKHFFINQRRDNVLFRLTILAATAYQIVGKTDDAGRKPAVHVAMALSDGVRLETIQILFKFTEWHSGS
ncbi:hypothetical protein [Pantoea sp. ARC607]|uniref:hypothetical protein n=1 Tax=unclassified Pantoea TaxID=2630326 RepID=UPI000DA896A0|nr:hypothetical protein [Pantoea sp. ARC607]PZL91781.1 hypothetical protein CKF43_16610 [Pantoea sp. ARC607]